MGYPASCVRRYRMYCKTEYSAGREPIDQDAWMAINCPEAKQASSKVKAKVRA